MPRRAQVAHDLIGRIMIQCARYRGLTKVIHELLGFEGEEFYAMEWPELVGRTFLDVQLSGFDHATPVGIVLAHSNRVVVNPQPAAETIIQRGDKIIVIAEDNDTYRPVSEPTNLERVDKSLGDRIRLRREPTQVSDDSEERKHFLFLGWRRDVNTRALLAAAQRLSSAQVMDMIHFLDGVCQSEAFLCSSLYDRPTRSPRLDVDNHVDPTSRPRRTAQRDRP